MGYFGRAQVTRGERNGLIVCHHCNFNIDGFCDKYKRWCSIVRYQCEPKEEPKSENRSKAWRLIYGEGHNVEVK